MMTTPPPVIYVLSGPNGSGKTTGASVVLPEFHTHEFVNADEIHKSLGPGASHMTAGRIMLERMKRLRDAKTSFAFETTLAARTYAGFLKDAQQSGFFIHLVFIWLRTPALAKARVALRVRRGGHDIPEADIERRYWRGLRNFFGLYSEVANAWTLCDNSGKAFVVVAQKSDERLAVYDQNRYDEIRRAAEQIP